MSINSYDQDFSVAYDIAPESNAEHQRLKHIRDILPDIFIGFMAALLGTTCYAILAPVVHEVYDIALSWDIQYPLIGLIGLSSGVTCFCITRRRTSSIDTSSSKLVC